MASFAAPVLIGSLSKRLTVSTGVPEAVPTVRDDARITRFGFYGIKPISVPGDGFKVPVVGELMGIEFESAEYLNFSFHNVDGDAKGVTLELYEVLAEGGMPLIAKVVGAVGEAAVPSFSIERRQHSQYFLRVAAATGTEANIDAYVSYGRVAQYALAELPAR